MKNQTSVNVSSAIKTTLTAAAFSLLLLASSSAKANLTEKETGKTIPTPIEVKYLGLMNNQPVFEMNIDNVKEDELYVTLKDDEGNMLYGEKVKDKSFSRKFQFANNDAGYLKVTLSLSSKKYRNPQVFEIGNVSRVVEDVVVTKL